MILTAFIESLHLHFFCFMCTVNRCCLLDAAKPRFTIDKDAISGRKVKKHRRVTGIHGTKTVVGGFTYLTKWSYGTPPVK